MNSQTIFKNGPKCEKCGNMMRSSMEILPLLDIDEPIACWKCSCGNATFSKEQLEELKQKKIKIS